MTMAKVQVRAIHNASSKPLRIPHQTTGELLTIEPGDQLDGPLVYLYDRDKEGPVPSPNEIWFIDAENSEDAWRWGTVSFPSVD